MNQNLREAMQEIATRETAEFILREMPKIVAVDSREQLWEHAFGAASVDGMICEFGVHRGYSINYLARLASKQTVNGFDSFLGIKENWRTGFHIGAFDEGGKPPLVEPNVQLWPGWFSATLPKFFKDRAQSSKLLHIDSDTYEAAVEVLDQSRHSLQRGTVIIFDDYFNYPTWREGEFKAWHEFTKIHDVAWEYLAYNAQHEQVAVQIL